MLFGIKSQSWISENAEAFSKEIMTILSLRAYLFYVEDKVTRKGLQLGTKLKQHPDEACSLLLTDVKIISWKTNKYITKKINNMEKDEIIHIIGEEIEDNTSSNSDYNC